MADENKRQNELNKIAQAVRDGQSNPFEQAQNAVKPIAKEELSAGRDLIDAILDYDGGRTAKIFDAISEPFTKWATLRLQGSIDAAQAVGRRAAQGDLEDKSRLRREITRSGFASIGNMNIAEAGLAVLRGLGVGVGAAALIGGVGGAVAGVAGVTLAPVVVAAVPIALAAGAAITGAMGVIRQKKSAMALGFFKEKVAQTDDRASLPAVAEYAIDAARAVEGSGKFQINGDHDVLIVHDDDRNCDAAFLAQRDFNLAVLPTATTESYGRNNSLTGDEIPAVIAHIDGKTHARSYEPALIRPTGGPTDTLANRLIALGGMLPGIFEGGRGIYYDGEGEDGAQLARTAAKAYLERQFGIADAYIPVPTERQDSHQISGPLLSRANPDPETGTLALLFSHPDLAKDSYRAYQPIVVDLARKDYQQITPPGRYDREYSSQSSALNDCQRLADDIAASRTQTITEEVEKAAEWVDEDEDGLDIFAPATVIENGEGMDGLSDMALSAIRSGTTLDEIRDWTPEFFREIALPAYNSLPEFRDAVRAIHAMAGRRDDTAPSMMLDAPGAMERFLPLLQDTAGRVCYDPEQGIVVEYNERASMRLLDDARCAAEMVQTGRFQLHGAYSTLAEVGDFSDLGQDYQWHNAPANSGLTGRELPVVLEHRNRSDDGVVYYEPAMVTLPLSTRPASLCDLRPLGGSVGRVGEVKGIALFRDIKDARESAISYMRMLAGCDDTEYPPLPNAIVDHRPELGPLLVRAGMTERGHLMMTYMPAQNAARNFDPEYLGYQVTLADMDPAAPFRSVVVPHRYTDAAYPQQFFIERVAEEIMSPTQFYADLRLRAAQDEIAKDRQVEHQRPTGLSDMSSAR